MKSIELFAGAGGLGMGLHRAGFEPVSVIEWNSDCYKTLCCNKARGHNAVKRWTLTQGDVRKVDFLQYRGKIRLVSGGPPCQPFSLGGKHRSYDDSRDMFPQAIRAVRDAQPAAFIFENVKGLTRNSFRNYFEYVRLQLHHPEIEIKKEETWTDHLARLEQHHTSGRTSGLKYRVVTQVVNAADYGVPQKRERVFFVGFREELGISWNFPLPTHSQEALLWDQIHGTYWDRHKVARKHRPNTLFFVENAFDFEKAFSPLPWRTVRDAIHDLPDPELKAEDGSVFNHKFQAGARSYTGHTGSLLDSPAKTLKAGVHGVPGGENMLLRPDGTVRYFTARESARLQTFPDDFIFQGSWTETMRQLGNAVPVKLAQVVGQHVARHLGARA